MAATPKVATAIGRGASGKGYSISMYCSDVVGAFNTFSLNGTAGAGSQNFYVLPEDITFVDFPVPTGLADTTSWVIQANDVNVGAVLQHAAFVNTIAARPNPSIGLKKGTKLTVLQA